MTKDTEINNLNHTGTAEEVRRIMEAHGPAQFLEIGKDGEQPINVLITHDNAGNQEINSILPYMDEYRKTPEFMRGTAILAALASFADHATRFKRENSVLYASVDGNATNAKITAIYDYHGAGKPDNGFHRAIYNFPLSEDWRRWMDKDGREMSQEDFAIFLEDAVINIELPPTPAQLAENEEFSSIISKFRARLADPTTMLELSKGLQVYAHEKVLQRHNIENGETQITFEHDHTDKEGKPLVIPNMFLISIPVFEGENPNTMLVRLRYRVKAGQVVWHYNIYQPLQIIKTAFRAECDTLAAAVELPLYYGTMESLSR